MLNTYVAASLTMNFAAPEAPQSAQDYMPLEIESFGEGLWYIIKKVVRNIEPGITDASGICLSLIAIILFLCLFESFSNSSQSTIRLVGSITISVLLFQPTNTLINLGIETVQQMSEYGKLLLPVMTAALAAQGGTTSSAALYTGTALFNALLTTALTKLLLPMIYIYLAICVANSVVGQETLKNISKFIKWLMTWCLKLSLYVFTGYISITGVISGAADAAAIKAAKIAISGAVPVVGNIISDASETILVSAGIMKNTAGIYGTLAFLALCVGPFLKIGVQYVLLKFTSGICSIFSANQTTGLIKEFTGILGFLLAIIGAMCMFLLISTVCFMKGVS